MLKNLTISLMLAAVSLASAETKKDDPSLVLKFDGPVTVNAGGEKIQINGPFVKAPDGKIGLAVGSTQSLPRIPASEFMGENGTIIFTFLNKPIKPKNAMLCRALLTLQGNARERISFYQISNELLYFAFKDYNDSSATGSTKPIEHNRWYQAACTWDGTTVKYFLDGKLQGEFKQPYVPKFPANSTFIYTGPFIDRCTNPAPWNEDSCLIREIKVYKRALTPQEIMASAGVKMVDASQGFKTFLSVPQVTSGPVMNGTLGEDAWKHASSIITLIDGQKPEESLSYKDNNPLFCHDGKNLYVGFQSVFPGNYKLIKGEARGEKEPDAWGSESFEFWLDINGKLYRFGGNVAGGYCESLMPFAPFDGQWQYKTTNKVRIDDCQVWQGEICIPFDTLGISNPVGKEIKVNFCRSWLGLERVGFTDMAGLGNYEKTDSFATLKISGSNTSFQEVAVNNPNFGALAQKLQASAGKDSNLEYSVKLLSSGGFLPEQSLVKKTISVKSGSVEQFDVSAIIESTSYDRLLFQVTDTAKSEVLMQQIVPFKIVENYLDVVPAVSSAKIYMTPRYSLLKSKTGGNPVQVEVVSPSNKIIFTTTIASNDEFAAPFARDNQVGAYRAVIFSIIDGKKKIFSSKTFNYHGIGPWEKPFTKERVLKPFEPLTIKGDGGNFDIGMWGRVYQYKNSLLPKTITSLKQPVLAGASFTIDGQEAASPLKVTKSTPSRVELAGQIKSAGYDLEQNSWIEYDGVLWNSIKLKAKKPLSGVQLKMDIPESMAKFYHATAAGFGAGGRQTEAINKDVNLAFWPVVWIGGYEQGLSWFAETNSTWKTSDERPIRIVKGKNLTSLEIKFADKLAKGQDIKIEFGLIATPVKPLPKNYPFTMFGDFWAVHLNPKAPRAPVTAAALLSNTRLGDGFYDLPLDAKRPTSEMTRVREAVEFGKKNNAIVFPYQSAIMIPEEYPVVKDNILEWQIGPANHLPYKYEETDTKEYVWYNVCPASQGANYYVYRFKELLKDIPLKGIYFDFGTAVPCSNRYHGCTGGYALLAEREFYKHIAEVLADANNGEYTIVLHNSESVQIPVQTFGTHYLNGEGLRQASSDVFHFGKDLLDHYTIADFASEHSSLQWGITSSIYVPTDPLAPQFGGDKEGGPGPQELYRFRMTKAAMAGALIHNTIPSQSRMHYGWFDKVIRFYDAFKVNEAEFMPYWRNGEYVRVVQGKDIYVSFYRHHDKKEILAVISHVSKEHLDQDVVVEFEPAKLAMTKLTSATELLTGPDPEYQRLYAETNRIRNPIELGDFGVEFKGLEGNRIKLKLKYHSVALVKICAE